MLYVLTKHTLIIYVQYISILFFYGYVQFLVSKKILNRPTGYPPSEAVWKPSYKKQGKGKHIKPAISVSAFITRAFSYEITRLCE